MLKPVQVTSEEKELLISWYHYGTSTLIRHRAHTTLLNSQGLSTHKISQLLFRDYKTIRNWLVFFKQSRLSSLFTKYRNNSNASKLTSAQKKQIKQVLSSPPLGYGIPKEFWQVKDLKKWLKARFGVVYESDRSYHLLLKLSRFSWKLPDRFDVRRDNKQVEKRLQKIRD